MQTPLHFLQDNLQGTANNLGAWLDVHGVNILVILVGAWLLRRFGANAISKVLSRTVRNDLYPTKADRDKRVKTLNSLVRAMMRVGVYVIAFILIVGEINPGYTTALFASAGLVTVALGFGAKDLINDFIKGIFIITENQYRVGDIVTIAGITGRVIDVTIRTTVLRDFDGRVHHVPNGSILTTTNKTMGYSLLNESLVFEPTVNMEIVEKLINEAGATLKKQPEMKDMIIDQPQMGLVSGYKGGGITVKIIGKTSPTDKYTVLSELYKLLQKDFKKHRIEPLSAMAAPPPTPPS